MIETSTTTAALVVRRATGLSSRRAEGLALAEQGERAAAPLIGRGEHVRCRVRRVHRGGPAAAAVGRYLANTPVAAVADCLCRVTVAV